MKQYQTNLLQYFLGTIFILAAIYRLFNYTQGITEFTNLNLPIGLIIPTILLELTLGILLILNKKRKTAIKASIIFLSIAIMIAIVTNFNFIITNVGELFIFNPDPTDILLHITYLIILISILKKNK